MNIAAHHSMADPVTVSGTSFLLKTNTNTRVLSIKSLVKDSSSSSITIDWGDGTSNVYTTNVNSVSHTYPGDDFYLLRISDDVSSIGFKASTNCPVIACFLSFGSKIVTIQSNCFQNYTVDLNSTSSNWCGLSTQQYAALLKQWTSRHELVVNATTIGSYSFFPRCLNVHLVHPETLWYDAFYADGLKYVKNLVINYNLQSQSFFNSYSQFIDNSATNYEYKSVTVSNKTVSQIQSMSNYPWRLNNATFPIYIHGTDGTINSGSLS